MGAEKITINTGKLLTKQKRENKVQTINISDGAGDEDPDNYSEFVPTPQNRFTRKHTTFGWAAWWGKPIPMPRHETLN